MGLSLAQTGLALVATLGSSSRLEALPRGRFEVGTTTVLRFDSTRIENGRPRPLQITTWYPSRNSTGARVTYGYYLDLAAGEKSPATATDIVAGRGAFVGFLDKAGVKAAAANRWIDTPMLAVANAEPLKSKFPLLVIVNGNGQSASDESSLAEYLASYGYVVATIPSYTRISHPPTSEQEIGPGSEEQADDIAFVSDAESSRADVRSGPIGLIAHSLGARGALLFAMRSTRAGALVSLDGGIGTATGRAAMQETRSFSAHHVSGAILHFYETTDSFMAPDFTLLRELRGANVTVAKVTGLHHHHFAGLGAWLDVVPGMVQATGAIAESGKSYEMMIDVARTFLDASLKAQKSAYVDSKRRASAAMADRAAFIFETLGSSSH